MRRAALLALAALAAAGLAACAGYAPAPAPERTDELFRRIELGMGRDEIRRLLGTPDETMAFSRSSTVAWDYRYVDTWGYFAVFSVTLDATGRAVGKISWRVNDGGDHQ